MSIFWGFTQQGVLKSIRLFLHAIYACFVIGFGCLKNHQVLAKSGFLRLLRSRLRVLPKSFFDCLKNQRGPGQSLQDPFVGNLQDAGPYRPIPPGPLASISNRAPSNQFQWDLSNQFQWGPIIQLNRAPNLTSFSCHLTTPDRYRYRKSHIRKYLQLGFR